MKAVLIIILSLFLLSSCTDNKKTEIKQTVKDSVAVKTDTITPPPIDSLIWEIEQFLKDSTLLNSSVGIIIAEDSLENIIFEYNPNLSLVPASVLKLVTTATAMEIMGGGLTFKTTLQHTGSIVEGHILDGDIIIKGGGDPTLGRDESTSIVTRWGNAIKKRGIDTITGTIIGDASIYEDELACPTWGCGELGNTYSQGPSGLTFNENSFELRFNVTNKGAFWSSASNMKPYVPGIRFNNLSKSAGVNQLETYFWGMPYCNVFDIQGYYPSSQGSSLMVGTLPDPALAAAYQLELWLNRNGVRVKDTATTIRELKLTHKAFSNERKEILTTYSKSLYSIISETNMVSRNLFAEHILKHLGLKRSGIGNRQSGLNAVMGFWSSKKMDTGGLFLHDGSGLSRFNGITSKQLAFVLSYMKNKTKHFESFKNTLPEAGKSGTMRRMGKDTDAEGRVFAKSGTMSRVSSYAGYVTTLKGKTLIFAIITNNFNCGFTEMKEKYEKIMVRMADWEGKI
jgi:D-alanyl-D-alanine carboxypeptidase/D-alanyl-D-alanine-endopeptidase (penicillin-binding protein 4)